LLLDPDRPIQLVIAGKSHPADEGGKRMIQEIVRYADEAGVRHRIAFLPNYDIAMAQPLYPGCDVWLNNPLRPYEACGTSGMKAALNGGLNLSILDGWWAEAYTPETGFAIGGEADGQSDDEQDALDAAALFDVLENQIVPAYYERDERGLSGRWLALMRASIEQLGSEYNTNRIVREYVETMYLPAHRALTGAIA
jgi:starch phosphorylase